MSEGIVLLIVLGGICLVGPIFQAFWKRNESQKFMLNIHHLIETNQFRNAQELLEKSYSTVSMPRGDVRHLGRYYLAQCYQNDERYNDALAQLEMVIAVHETQKRIPSWSTSAMHSAHASTRYLMAQCFDELGEEDQRDQQRRKAGELYLLADDPGMAHYLFGCIRNDIGDYSRAITSFEEALTYSDQHPDPQQFRASVLMYLSNALSETGQYTAARLRTLESLELGCDTTQLGDVYASLAGISNSMGDREEASRYLKKAVETGASNEYICLTRARMYKVSGRLSDARTEAVSARTGLEPEQHVRLLRMEASAATMQGDWHTAESLLNNALEKVGFGSSHQTRFDRAEIIFDQAGLYEEQGAYREAMVALSEAEPEIIWHPSLVWECATLRLLLTIRIGNTHVEKNDLENLQSKVESAISNCEIENEGICCYSYAVTNMAQAWCKLGEWAKGRMLFEQAFEASKMPVYQARYQFKIAECHEREGNQSQAVILYRCAANCDTEERHKALAQKRLDELTER